MWYISIQSCISVAVFIVPEVVLVFILYEDLLNKMEYVLFSLLIHSKEMLHSILNKMKIDFTEA